jgi:hypothetical protein
MLKVESPDVKPWDFKKIQRPSMCHFLASMQGRFAGRPVLGTTIEVFMDLVETENEVMSIEMLYTNIDVAKKYEEQNA